MSEHEHVWQFAGLRDVDVWREVLPQQDWDAEEAVGIWPFRHKEMRHHTRGGWRQLYKEPKVVRACLCGAIEVMDNPPSQDAQQGPVEPAEPS